LTQLEFLYARQQELMQSPYYAHTQNMTQDLDRFYKDLMQNDLFTNLKKYCTILYDVIKSKYYPLIPFGEYLTILLSFSFYIYKYIHTFLHIIIIYNDYIFVNVNMTQFSTEHRGIFWGSPQYDSMNSLKYLFSLILL